MVVNAIAYETNSIVLDLSPNFIDGKYPGGKKKDDEMVATVMLEVGATCASNMADTKASAVPLSAVAVEL